jgi:hypothetical protein
MAQQKDRMFAITGGVLLNTLPLAMNGFDRD